MNIPDIDDLHEVLINLGDGTNHSHIDRDDEEVTVWYDDYTVEARFTPPLNNEVVFTAYRASDDNLDHEVSSLTFPVTADTLAEVSQREVSCYAVSRSDY